MPHARRGAAEPDVTPDDGGEHRRALPAPRRGRVRPHRAADAAATATSTGGHHARQRDAASTAGRRPRASPIPRWPRARLLLAARGDARRPGQRHRLRVQGRGSRRRRARASPRRHRHRRRPPRFANRYLKRIRYGNTRARRTATTRASSRSSSTTASTTPTRRRPTRRQPWPCAADPFSTVPPRLRGPHLPALPARPDVPPLRRARGDALPGALDGLHLRREPGRSTQLVSVTHAGYVRDPRRASPTRAVAAAARRSATRRPTIHTDVQVLDRGEPRRTCPRGVDGPLPQWVDLDGEGIPGVLVARADALVYKRNLGGGRARAGAGARRCSPAARASAGRRQQLADLDGDGQQGAGRSSTRPMRRLPRAHRRRRLGAVHAVPVQPDHRLGRSEPALHRPRRRRPRGRAHRRRRTPSPGTRRSGKDGFGQPDASCSRGATRSAARGSCLRRRRRRPIFLADMTGDGLADLVRDPQRRGLLLAEPRLRPLRAPRCTMGGAPRFDRPGSLRPAGASASPTSTARARPTSLYLRRDGVRFCAQPGRQRLRAGRSTLPRFPQRRRLGDQSPSSICSARARPAWSGRRRCRGTRGGRCATSICMGGRKPHLLTSRHATTSGSRRRSTYAPVDQVLPGRPAAGRAVGHAAAVPGAGARRASRPYDAVSEVPASSRTYAYHHGYFDGVEREFRGFGMVEQRDAESFSPLRSAGRAPARRPAGDGHRAALVPPVVTKTWFHTGDWPRGRDAARPRSRTSTTPGDRGAACPTLPAARALGLEERARRAARSRARSLRQEVYARGRLGGAPRSPYAVVRARSYEVRLLQPARERTHAVVLRAPARGHRLPLRAQDAAGPTIRASRTRSSLEVDDFGAVLRSAAVGYPRRRARTSMRTDRAGGARRSRSPRRTSSPRRPRRRRWYRLGVPIETRDVRAHRAHCAGDATASSRSTTSPAPARTRPRRIALRRAAGRCGCRSGSSRRSGTLYLARRPVGAAAARAGRVAGAALPELRQAFTPALLAARFGGPRHGRDPRRGRLRAARRATPRLVDPVAAADLLDAARVLPARRRSSIRSATRRPSPTTATTCSSPRSTDPVEQRRPVRRTTTASSRPSLVTDPNGNRAAAQFDALGMVIATAVMGKDGADRRRHARRSRRPRVEYDLDRCADDRAARAASTPGARAARRREHALAGERTATPTARATRS